MSWVLFVLFGRVGEGHLLIIQIRTALGKVRASLRELWQKSGCDFAGAGMVLRARKTMWTIGLGNRLPMTKRNALAAPLCAVVNLFGPRALQARLFKAEVATLWIASLN